MAVSTIKVGDTVIILTGKDKKKKGTVLRKHGCNHLVVEGINLVKKNMRGNPQKNEKGGIVEREAPVHISNVAMYNPQTKKADRMGVKLVGNKEQQKRVRYFKSNNEVIDV